MPCRGGGIVSIGHAIQTKGTTMDSTLLMFTLVMLSILVGGIVVYKKTQ
mgnify:CR=1 FL=1